ncbi:hypothetical protein FGO68_gene3712 [Halteria grandinella]|uniref:Uncharacterized protein n=1 Tax=Halteria grandinella TaxID=5974 RepID=A0A8J8T5E8_HALGN|nr:hypothetical protein FGO68_gene3712 [Halteria grandinella]
MPNKFELQNQLMQLQLDQPLIQQAKEYRPFEDSLILADDAKLKTMVGYFTQMGKQKFTVSLLYRATRDGFVGIDFHRTCDNKGPTITIIHTTTDHVQAATPLMTGTAVGNGSVLMMDGCSLLLTHTHSQEQRGMIGVQGVMRVMGQYSEGEGILEQGVRVMVGQMKKVNHMNMGEYTYSMGKGTQNYSQLRRQKCIRLFENIIYFMSKQLSNLYISTLILLSMFALITSRDISDSVNTYFLIVFHFCACSDLTLSKSAMLRMIGVEYAGESFGAEIDMHLAVLNQKA